MVNKTLVKGFLILFQLLLGVWIMTSRLSLFYPSHNLLACGKFISNDDGTNGESYCSSPWFKFLLVLCVLKLLLPNCVWFPFPFLFVGAGLNDLKILRLLSLSFSATVVSSTVCSCY